ncbi:sigma-E factor negative regulatory protein [Pusillimonas sp. ANT_WB101]|uniref:sigma-E factor negative regulatory protein n=1 Tax=Pusillimonas sp. ANT_WB101 TaxID=2597356 RepID=UPI0011ED9EDC|nr:sigma-E factor negative regulatory protein [Pusillimonas sp. ANT_WB101]KAA0888580.1 hypothetical protein FQ179_21730 [Pusillimonas sp. ANT_WB101]
MQVAKQSHQDQEQASWEASVSSWVDGEGEIRPEELDSPYGRHVWDTYHLIGDAMRNEELAIKPSDLFYARISKAIDAEPHIVAPRISRHALMRTSLSGLAVVAAMASVAWVASPYFFPSTSGPSNVQVLASSGDDTRLADYLDAHREIVGASPVRQASFEVSR